MASSESHQADELTIPKESLPLLEQALPRVQRTHGVRVSLLPTTPELSQQWVRLEGPAAGRNKAKDYIKALCSPDVGMDVSYSQPLHCIWAGAGGAWHRAVENLSGAAVTVTEVGTLHVSGTDLQVMMAISTLENLQSVYRGSEKAAATRESLDQDRRFRRLLQTIGDGSACDEQLQDLPSAVKQLLMEWIEEDAGDTSLSRDLDLDEDESSDDSFELIEDVVPMKSSSKDQPETDAADKDDAAHTGIASFTSGTRESDTRDDQTSDVPSEADSFLLCATSTLSSSRAEAAGSSSHCKTASRHDQKNTDNVRFLKNFAARLQISEDLVDRAILHLGTEVDINTLLDYVERIQTSEPDQNDDDDSMEIADDKQQKRQASSDDDIVEIPVGSSNRPVTKTIPERQTTSRNTPKVNRTENAADVSINKGFRYDKPPNQENIRLLKKFAEDFEIPEHLVDRAIADLGSEVDVNTMLDHIATINSGQDVVVMETGDDKEETTGSGDDDDVTEVENSRRTTEESGEKSDGLISSCKICRDLGYTDEEIAMAVSRVGEEASLPALLQEVRNINREKQKKERAKPEESNYKAGETVVLPPTRKIFPAGNAANNRSADVMLRPQAPQTIPTVGYVPLLGRNPYPNQAVVRPVPVILLPTPQQAMVRPYHSLAAEVQAAQNRQFHHARNRTPPSASQSSAAGTGNSFKVGSPPKKQNKQFQDQSVVREQAVVPNLVEKVQKMGEYKLDLPDGPGDDSLRPVVIDGSNVAMSHGKRNFSSRGIALCVEYFWKRGHRDITVFVPNFRKGASTESYLLIELEEKGLLSFTPSRRIKGRTVASYDDRYIVRLAAEKGGVIVSNDNYRDLLDESEAWRDVIENRLLLFTFVGDRFMPPDDPFGRNGPSLDDLLRKQSQKPHRGHNVPPQGPKAGYPGVGNEPLLPGAAAAAAPISQAQVQLFQQLMQVFPGQEDKIRRVLQSNPEMADLNAVSAMVLDVDL
ncbi:PREDICTED: NEDD4-binding protein 1-like [Branchiostoma belcheri]|uniref:NEDD4-binding protein 1-like n=1 Tax=Branchiostoma belcheri TaxID=7741 RepID=A0A6P4ZNE3_BRABE|nr:PREDICTED: NEDD4-binding protein 1-like [Branchiostoma belcheri]